MRYVLMALAWYLDLLVYLTASFLFRFLVFPLAEWPWFADLAVFVVLRLAVWRLSMTPGDWILSQARLERQESGSSIPRQWPNLLAGTLLFLEGTKSAVRWLEGDHPIPFIGFIPEGGEQGVIGIATGVVLMAAGIGILRFNAAGRTVGVVALAITIFSTVLSWDLWDTAIARLTIARRATQGISVRGDEIAFMQGLVPEAVVGLIVLMSGLLLFCRTR